MRPVIEHSWQQHQQVFAGLRDLLSPLERLAQACIATLERGGKIVWMGNGGSAADCQHLAAELVGRFSSERQPLPSLALTVDTSILTAVANDYGYDEIFARQITALCSKADLVCGISTSGRSANVLHGLRTARELGATTAALVGVHGLAAEEVDYCLAVPSSAVPRIQECHLFIGHTLCECIDVHFIERSRCNSIQT